MLHVDTSSLRAPWKHGPYSKKDTEEHKNTQNTKTHQTFIKNYIVYFFVFFRIFIFYFIYYL